MREIDEETRKRYVDEDNKLSAVQGGLIVFLIMPAICLWIVYERNNPYGDSAIYMIAILLSIPAVFIIGYVVRVRFYSKEKRLVLGQVKNKANQAKDALISKKQKYPSVSSVTYHQGFPGVIEEIPYGTLLLLENTLSFYNDHPFMDTNGQIVFEIPYRNIEKVIYDLSETITLSKFLLLGIGAFAFKKKNYYLIIEFISENGVRNQVILDTSDKKNTQLYNYLITKIDEGKKGSLPPDDSSILGAVKKLSELRDLGIITEEEFIEKKQLLLDKIK